MARPPLIQKLRHGTLLTGRLYRWFVETWNWLTGYVDNLRGDFDANPAQGFISVDRTNPDVPVIRFRKDRLPAGGGGASVSLDDISLDWNDGGEAQIKDFDTGTPAAATTVAADIVNGASNPDKFVCRDANGKLVYKSPGSLSGQGGITLTGVKIVTNIQWSTVNHELEIRHATVNITNGIITSWVDRGDQAITSTSISSILGS